MTWSLNQRCFILLVLGSLASVTESRGQGIRPIPLQVDPRAASASAALRPSTLFDSAYGRPRQVWVYLPANYDPRRAAPYPLLVAFDGADYRDTMPLPLILDTLAATRRAPPFVAVLIDNGSGAERIADLGNAPRMVQFLASQLVPWVRSRWHVTTDPQRVIITGSSAGGLGAAYAALNRPDLFGNVLSQSGAFWRGLNGTNGAPYEWLTQHVSTRQKANVRFVLDVGELEDHATLGGAGPNFRDANRRFHTALEAKGYRVSYTEVPQGQHAPAYWQQRLPAGIVELTAGWQDRP